MDHTIDLLIELATLDEVECYVPNHKDQLAGLVPENAELVLRLRRASDPSLPAIHADLALRRADGELLIEMLHDVLHPSPARSAAEQLWGDLDHVVDRIQDRVERGLEPRKADVLRAQVLVHCLAVMLNPHQPSDDAVREMAMERWEDRNPNAA